jgi:hypothetical protein
LQDCPLYYWGPAAPFPITTTPELNMTKLLLLLFTIVSIATAANDVKKTLHAHPVSEEVILDGKIDPIWSAADSTIDFFQLEPHYNKPPAHPTVAKILTTPEALYCLMICYDDQSNVQLITGLLDNPDGDVVSIMLDTFNDRQTAYKFAVSASGVRADCRLLDDARNRDYSWDGVWFSATKVYSWGFVVEMKIPYKSIRYNGDLTEWGLDFDRWSANRKEDLYWNSYLENEGQRISKFGQLVFDGTRPNVTGLNLEVYPVGIAKATYLHNNTYDIDPDAGVDIFYNPSEKLTFQLTANPDFAQIEADPFDFNISRYESHFDERRPFFTEGNEVFTASGRERNSGFYRPLELFYSRRIGKLLPDGTEVPLQVGTKAFGRLGDWEYGGFYARAGGAHFTLDGEGRDEPSATFVSGRVKTHVLENSSLGVLFVGKHSMGTTSGVLDIDGALRTSTWQASYQFARSIQGARGDYATSLGFTLRGKDWMTLSRIRAIGNDFDVSDVGYVPWRGTGEVTFISGPRWYFNEGAIKEIQLYGGGGLYYEHADLYTDRFGILGYNMQFRDNWGFEIDLSAGKSLDAGKKYTGYEVDYSMWMNISPRWHANIYGVYSRTFNFMRDYLGYYLSFGSELEWKMLDEFEVGTSYNQYVEWKPTGALEDITYNARPYFSLTPVNNLNFRVYVDNVFVRSSDKLEHVILGFLFSYNFLPKSWIYLAVNQTEQRDELTRHMQVAGRAAVLKVKYLYYL